MVSSTMVMLFYNRELSFFCMGRQKKGGGACQRPQTVALDISLLRTNIPWRIHSADHLHIHKYHCKVSGGYRYHPAGQISSPKISWTWSASLLEKVHFSLNDTCSLYHWNLHGSWSQWLPAALKGSSTSSGLRPSVVGDEIIALAIISSALK